MMSETISIRLTPERKNLLEEAKRHFKVKKNSDVIDLALKISLRSRSDYESRLKAVVGCIKLAGKKDAVERIRALRGNG